MDHEWNRFSVDASGTVASIPNGPIGKHDRGDIRYVQTAGPIGEGVHIWYDHNDENKAIDQAPNFTVVCRVQASSAARVDSGLASHRRICSWCPPIQTYRLTFNCASTV